MRPPYLQQIGMVTAAIWTDIDKDGWQDLALVGEFMPLTFIKNQGDNFNTNTNLVKIPNTEGWWSSIASADFDGDGDMDFIAGNVGLNTRYKATEKEPLCIYAKDFDKNGRIDPILCYYSQGINYMARTRPQYSMSLGSEFYKYAKNVCITGNSLTDEQRIIGSFWDDNPNTSVTSGHVTYFQQKLSPAGHWMHLTATIIEKENLDLMRSTEVFSKVAMGIFDGFISCWEAKYKYCLVRPETFINKYINKEWQPLIQTPPFPEYPSGHSVVSGSAATVLTHFFG